PHFPMTAPPRFADRFRATNITEPFVPKSGASYDHPVSRLIRQGFETGRIDYDEMMNGRAGYFACISYLDEIIGDMLARLEASDLLDNTIIVYASDHGEMAGELGTWWKSGWYEGCCRVPLLVSTPEQRRSQQPRRNIATAVSLVDLAPTLAALGGGTPLSPVTGIDLSPAIVGSAEVPDRPIFCDHLNVRWGPGSEFRSIRLGNWKYVAFRDHDGLLFDLSTDLYESENLIDTAPPSLLAELQKHALDYDRINGPVARRQAELRAKYPLQLAAGATPSQFLLDEGKLVGADVTIYKPAIITEDPSNYFADWPATASERLQE
ncbi:MAG: sulfatase, partial [Pseudorhodoplanes sp.]